MYDRFLVLLDNGNEVYTFSMRVLMRDCAVVVLKHERTFDNGKTWIEVKY